MVSEHVNVWLTRPPTWQALSFISLSRCSWWVCPPQRGSSSCCCLLIPTWDTLTAPNLCHSLSVSSSVITNWLLKSAHIRGVPMFLRSCSQRPQWLDRVRVWGSCTDFHKWGLFESGSFLHQSTVDALQTGSCASTQQFCCWKTTKLSPFVPCSLQWKRKVMLITESDKPTVINWSAIRSVYTHCLSYIWLFTASECVEGAAAHFYCN